MTETNSNKLLTVLVLLVVVLSVVFTWQTLTASDYGENDKSGPTTNKIIAQAQDPPVRITGGAVGIIVQPQPKGGA